MQNYLTINRLRQPRLTPQRFVRLMQCMCK
jgi:hypothetical protein